jgi:hypothetical protein
MKMEHLYKIVLRKWNSSQIRCNGEEIKYKSFAAKDTANERYQYAASLPIF